MDNNGADVPSGSRDLAPTLHGIDFTLIVVSTVFVGLRLFTRVKVTRDIGWDDYTIIIALAVIYVGKAFVVVEVVNALGRHKAVVQELKYRLFLKYDLMDWVQCIVVLAVSKLAICFFLLRLTQFHRLRYGIWALSAFIVATHIPFLVLLLLRCQPIQKYWDQERPGTCAPKENTEIVIIVQGAISILIDLICAACPIVLLRKAKIKHRVKVQLCLLMGFGFLTALVCCVRTGFSYQTKSSDLSWVGVPNAIARMIEVNMGIWAACAPMMKPLARYLRKRLFNHIPHTRETNTSSISFWHRSWWASRSRSRQQPPPPPPPTQRLDSLPLSPLVGTTRTVDRRRANSSWRISSFMWEREQSKNVNGSPGWRGGVDTFVLQELDRRERSIQNGAFLDVERSDPRARWSDATLKEYPT